MKITKNQIKQIILEELDVVLNEQWPHVGPAGLGKKPRSLRADVPEETFGIKLGQIAKTSPEEVAITPTPGDAPPVLTKITKNTPIVPGMPKKQVWSILTKRGHDWRSKWWAGLDRNDQSRVEYRAWWADFTLKRDKDRLERHRRELDRILAMGMPSDMPSTGDIELDPEASAGTHPPGIAAFGGTGGTGDPVEKLATLGAPEEKEAPRRIPPFRGVATTSKTN